MKMQSLHLNSGSAFQFNMHYFTFVFLCFLFLAPADPPMNIKAKPASSDSISIEWEEPETPNGIIRVWQTADYCIYDACHYIRARILCENNNVE